MVERIGMAKEKWRIILSRRDGSELLLFKTGGAFVLPQVEIPQHTRQAQALNSEMKHLWNLDVFSLYPLAPSLSSRVKTKNVRFQVMEAIECDAVAPQAAHWLSVSSFIEIHFAEVDDECAIREWQQDLANFTKNPSCTPFGIPGCLARLQAWTQETLQPFGVKLSTQFVQFNASKHFSLVRFATDSDAVWFKAVGPPNLFEFPISRSLTKLFPEFLPRILGIRDDWNAWLTTEVAGEHPDAEAGIETWNVSATMLAHLQIDSLGKTLHLIEAGCRDLRVSVLRDLLDPFVDAISQLMEEQTIKPPAPLTRRELRSLAEDIRSCLSYLSTSSIPNSLGHLDLNPQNIVVSKNRCVFLDWMEAYVGCPFFTLQYLIEHRRRLCGSDAVSEQAVIGSYKTLWESFAPSDEIETALQLAPLLAAFAYGVSALAWRDTGKPDPQSATYLRSLARRMKREAESLRERRLAWAR
jgi:hypothetical protein